jgi:hypothetical protein
MVKRLNYKDSVKAPMIIEIKPLTVRVQPVMTEYLIALCEYRFSLSVGETFVSIVIPVKKRIIPSRTR